MAASSSATRIVPCVIEAMCIPPLTACATCLGYRAVQHRNNLAHRPTPSATRLQMRRGRAPAGDYLLHLTAGLVDLPTIFLGKFLWPQCINPPPQVSCDGIDTERRLRDGLV